MDRPRHIYDLADELLSEILSFLLEPGSPALSGKSLCNGPNGTKIYGEASNLDRFRLVCHRFMRIGTPRKFSRFNLRFSEDGFRRLGDLLDMHLASYVKTVTYLVRPFYQGSGTRHSTIEKTRMREKEANTADDMSYRVGTDTANPGP